MVPRFQPPDILSNSYWAVRLPLASCTLINLQKRLTENVSISIHQSILKIMAKKIRTFWIVVQVFWTVLALQNAPWFSLYMTKSKLTNSVAVFLARNETKEGWGGSSKVQDKKGKTFRDYAVLLMFIFKLENLLIPILQRHK